MHIVRTLRSILLASVKYDTVLLNIVTMLHIRSPELSHLTMKFVPSDQHLPLHTFHPQSQEVFIACFILCVCVYGSYFLFLCISRDFEVEN